MRNKLNRIVLLDFLFIVLLFASGMTQDLTSELLYVNAFLLPLGIGCVLLFSQNADPKTLLFPTGEEKKNLLLAIPLAAPTLLFIFLFAWLTSFLLGLTGKSNPSGLTGDLWKDLLFSALIPAVGEELLFRYLPLRFLEGEDQRHAVFFSALFFSLIHCNLFQLPYAFVAGLLFAVLDLVSGSVLPSVVLHFLNNAVSILWIGKNDGRFLPVYLGALGVFTLVSILPILKKKEEYFDRFSALFATKSKLFFSLSAISFTLFLLYAALASFFG